MATSSQKHIARNRAPRVQIEYDVELDGAEKRVQLPFVMGVLSDLSGKPEVALPPVADRRFIDVDVDSFDACMKSFKPRVSFDVENKIRGKDLLKVDIRFEKLDDFSPAVVAAKIGAVDELLQARKQLSNLLTYMDGKQGAEGLVQQVLDNPALLSSLGSTRKPGHKGTEEPPNSQPEASQGEHS